MPGSKAELSDPDIYQVAKRESDNAISTLQSIFPAWRETESDYLPGEWGGASDLTCGEIEAELQILAKDLSWPTGAADGKWLSTAADAAECHQKVAEFIKHGLWPLTNIVRCAHDAHCPASYKIRFTDSRCLGRIYLSAQVLKTGIVLADLPGKTPPAIVLVHILTIN